MLKRFLENREAINMLSMNNLLLPSFSQNELLIISSLCQILQPIKSAAIQSQNRTTSIGHAIPLAKLIKVDLETAPLVKDFPAVQKAIVSGITNLCNIMYENRIAQ
jgi:hypothetical protein